MISGSMALEGPLAFWVSTHRRHHRYADELGDPHSPNLSGTGPLAKLKGLWYAHIPWMFSDQESRVNVFAPDVLRDRHLYNYSRTYPIWALLACCCPPLRASRSAAPPQRRSRASSSAGWPGCSSPIRRRGVSGRSATCSARDPSSTATTARTTGRWRSSPSARAFRTTTTRSPVPTGTQCVGGSRMPAPGCWPSSPKRGSSGICTCRAARRSTAACGGNTR